MGLAAPPREKATIVLLDPTSADGESSLDLLEPSDRRVTLVVLLNGPFSRALWDYALSEELDVSAAASIYLDQVSARIDRAGRVVEVLSLPGPDPAPEVEAVAAVEETCRVLLPSSLERLDPAASARLARSVGAASHPTAQPHVALRRRRRPSLSRLLGRGLRLPGEVLDVAPGSVPAVEEPEQLGSAELLAIDKAVLPGRASLTLGELAAKAGADVDVVRAFWRTLGFVDPVEDERCFGKRDVAIVKELTALTRDGLVEAEMAPQMGRVIGMATAQIATAVVDASEARSRPLDEGDDCDPPTAFRHEADADPLGAVELLPFMTEVIEYSFRRHLRSAARRRLSLSALDGGDQVVGFADLVRFTDLSARLDEKELARLVARFDETVNDVVIRHGGRVVKMMGDGAMFAITDSKQAAQAALELSHAVARDDRLPGLRIGLAKGPVLSKDGDLYGPVVNLASRLGAFGRAGAVNGNQEFRDAIAGDPRFTLRSLGRRSLRHIGDVRIYRLRAGSEWTEQPHRSGRAA